MPKEKKTNYESYGTYIRKNLRKVDPEMGSTAEATRLMDGIAHEIFSRLVKRSWQLCTEKDKKTLGMKELMLAGEQCFGEEIWDVAKQAAEKAIEQYGKSREDEAAAAPPPAKKEKRKKKADDSAPAPAPSAAAAAAE